MVEAKAVVRGLGTMVDRKESPVGETAMGQGAFPIGGAVEAAIGALVVEFAKKFWDFLGKKIGNLRDCIPRGPELCPNSDAHISTRRLPLAPATTCPRRPKMTLINNF